MNIMDGENHRSPPLQSHLEADTGNISDGMTTATESSNQDFVLRT
jgi:hypothetical protein